jgi:hypothetical protein
VLKLGRIWAVNVGENFNTTMQGWRDFCQALPKTNVQYMYASEHHFLRTDLKTRMRDAIRANRVAQRTPHDPAVVRCVGNMWFNPKVGSAPPRSAPRRGGAAAKAAAAAARRRGGSPPPERVMQRRPGKRTLVLTPRAAAATSPAASPQLWRGGQRTGVRSAVLKRRAAEAEAQDALGKRARR